MELHGLGAAGNSLPIMPTQSTQSTPLEQASRAAGASDQVEISEMGRLLDQISRLPEIREEKITAIRQAIADGVYETPEKLEIAVEKLLSEIRAEG